MEKARNISKTGFGKNQVQKGSYSGSTKRQKESPLCFIELKNAEFVGSQNYRSTNEELCRIVLRGDIVKDDSGA